MHEIVLRKGALKHIEFHVSANLRETKRQLNAILRPEIENLNFFLHRINPVSFLPISIRLKKGFAEK